MGDVVYVVSQVVLTCLSALELAMLIRAILSWIPSLSETRFGDFIYMLTEIIVAPVRSVTEKMNLFGSSPIDFSFLIAYILLSLLQSLVLWFTSVVL